MTSRGNAKAPTFLAETDYQAFLSGLAVGRRLDGLLCHAYCLMPNHYHLLLETPRANLDAAMHRLNSTYAIRFNRHHERTGHVFQGRYGAKLITTDSYARSVVRYIALNPVEAALCAAPEEWPWSSYAATAGLAAPEPFLTSRMADWFGDPEEYRKFVTGGLGHASLDSRPPLRDLVPTREPTLIAAAHLTYGYRLAEIADHLGIHLSSVWRDVRRGTST